MGGDMERRTDCRELGATLQRKDMVEDELDRIIAALNKEPL